MFVAGNKLLITVPWDYEPLGDVSVYDPVLNNWTNTKMGEPRIGYAHAVIGNKVFFAGGFQNYSGSLDLGSETARVDIYDLTTNSWSAANLSEPRG
jgi:N-acetylneuraminic acid mutarotase